MSEATERKLTELELYPVRGRYLPLSPDELHQLEQIIGETIPCSYSQFIQRYGQSAFHQTVRAWTLDSMKCVMVELFLGNRRSLKDVWDPTSLQVNIELFRGQMPTSLIPIGIADDEDFICLCISGPNRGNIYLWDREVEIESGGNVHLMASSFDDFIDRLEVFTWSHQ